MKITARTLAAFVHEANSTHLSGYPFGFRLFPPVGIVTGYEVQIIPRRSGAFDPVMACYGTPREVMAAMQAVLLVLPLVQGLADAELTLLARRLADVARRPEGWTKAEHDRSLDAAIAGVMALLPPVVAGGPS